MKSSLKKYIRGFWSPEKLIIAFAFLLSVFWSKFHPFYFILCNFGNKEPDFISCASQSIIENLLSPLAVNAILLAIFFSLLLLLPLSLFYTWLKYIASWSIPLGILVYAAGSDGTNGVGMLGSGLFSYAGMLQVAVYIWLALLVGCIVWAATQFVWLKYRTA